jgi:Mce-associated membrane protein
VIKAGVEELHPNSALALVFVKLATASKERPQPIYTSSSLRVTLTNTNGSWLIEKLEAVEPPHR